jgi:hypothetical protein
MVNHIARGTHQLRGTVPRGRSYSWLKSNKGATVEHGARRSLRCGGSTEGGDSRRITRSHHAVLSRRLEIVGSFIP